MLKFVQGYDPGDAGPGYLPDVKTSGSMPAGAYHTFVDTCWKSLHPAQGADSKVLTRTFTGLYQAKQVSCTLDHSASLEYIILRLLPMISLQSAVQGTAQCLCYTYIGGRCAEDMSGAAGC